MKRNQYPTREEVLQYYINDMHTVKECAVYFNIGISKFYRCLKDYGIVRTKEDKIKVYTKAQNSEEVKQRILDSNMKKYGAVNKLQANSTIQFVSDSMFSIKGTLYEVSWLKQEYLNHNLSSNEMALKLGVTYALLNKICKHYNISKNNSQRYELIKQSVKNKYNVESTLQLDNVKEKSRHTCLNKYGAENCMQNKQVQEKQKKTNLQKYGCVNYSQSQEYKQRALKTNLAKYGGLSHMQKDIEHKDIWNTKEYLLRYLQSLPEKPTVYNLMLFFNLKDRTAIYDKINTWKLKDYINLRPSRSHYEDDIVQFLKEIGCHNILLNARNILKNQEIDIYLPDYKFGIEFNGDYWHSDIFFSDHNGRSTHHQEKSIAAEQKGIFLFQIFEHEWNDLVEQSNIKNRIKTILQKNTIKIGARKCRIVDLSKEEKKRFLNENHIQGNDRSSKQYGLYYQNTLLCCMTFVRPKNNKYGWELSRFCNKHDYSVQGGASKLFKYFIKNLAKGTMISSYNDVTKTKGDLYKILGFNCVSINQPNYVWINFKTGDVRTRYQEQSGNEIERMHSKGYHRVCDCGTKTWVYIV